MRNFILILTIVVLVFGCGGKEAKSPDFLYGSKLYNNFVMFYLKGKARLAEMAFANAENQFLKMDAMCNLSRIYIGRYVLDEEGSDQAVMARAVEYAKLADCVPEREVIAYLKGETFDKENLPSPYNIIDGKSAEKIAEIAADEKLPAYTRTRLLRKAAKMLIDEDAEKAEKLMNDALVLDRFHGWSLNLLRDLDIIKSARISGGKAYEDINKRIELVKTVLRKK